MRSMRVAIIGGGPGGLMTAYLLQQRTPFPCAITLFEAGKRLGGKIVSRQFSTAPVAYEAGAAELYDYSRLGPDPLRDLITALGLSTRAMVGETVVLGERILKTDGDIRRELGDDTLQALRRFDRMARSAISPAEYYESDWKEDNDDPLSRRSFRALLERVPDAAARRYLEVIVHSDLATEPAHTNAMYGLQNYLMNTPEYMRLYTIDGGIERLPHELAKRLDARLLLEQPVVRVERTPQDNYRVFSRRHGEIQSEDFDFVVVALPNNWIPLIDWGGAVLAEAMRRHHAHYDYPAHYLRVSLLFEKPFWREQINESYFMLDAFGGCCVYDESSRNGCGPYGVLGWLLAGEAALTMSNFEDDLLIEQVLDSLPRCLRPGRLGFLEGRVHRWVGTVNGLPGGRPAREPDSRHLPEPVEHPWLFVVGDYLFDSTINGVLDSADVVAEWIVEEIAEYQPPQTNGIPATLPVPGSPTRNGSANGHPVKEAVPRPATPV
jgi:monoamine oxidase